MEVIFEMIRLERARQDAKWGKNRIISQSVWITILVEEVGEIAKALLKFDRINAVEEIIHTAAVCVCWLECEPGWVEAYETSINGRKEY